jgi:hypothetical protein
LNKKAKTSPPWDNENMPADSQRSFLLARLIKINENDGKTLAARAALLSAYDLQTRLSTLAGDVVKRGNRE